MLAAGDRVVLVLSGGNALGAYQGGVYQALEERGIVVDWVIGASAGAVNGAIICGNSSADRLGRLREFWRLPAGSVAATGPAHSFLEEARRTLGAHRTLAMGRPHVFVPRRLFGPWWEPFGNRETGSLYDTSPLERTLSELVDFDLLNRGPTRFSALAVDLERGEEVVFDTRGDTLAPEHVRASSALLPLFPAVEIDGRLFADGGTSSNLPLDPVLADPPPGDTLVLAIDLLPLRAPRPTTLGEAAERVQDLMFAAQGRRAIEAWQRVYDLQSHVRAQSGQADASMTLVHLAYGAQGPEVCGKAFDFSPGSVAYRWEQGQGDMDRVLDRIAAGEITVGGPGLKVHRFSGQESAG